MNIVWVNDGRDFLKLERHHDNVFRIGETSLATDKWLDLVMYDWDDSVEDLDDGGSDEAQCFGFSTELKVGSVTVTSEEIIARSVEEVQEAVRHISFGACDLDDI